MRTIGGVRAGERRRGWRKPYGLWLDEWAYRDVPRGYIVEPYLGTRDALPVDYEIYVFGGVAHFVQVRTGRGCPQGAGESSARHRWILFDRDWRQISVPSATDLPASPRTLSAMLEADSTMARSFDFARVDFYEIGGPDGPQPMFGEITFDPGSGLDPFDPDELDLALGALWPASSDPAPADIPAPVADLPLEPTPNPC